MLHKKAKNNLHKGIKKILLGVWLKLFLKNHTIKNADIKEVLKVHIIQKW